MSKEKSAEKVRKKSKEEVDELKAFIERKKVQNKALKKIIDNFNEPDQSQK